MREARRIGSRAERSKVRKVLECFGCWTLDMFFCINDVIFRLFLFEGACLCGLGCNLIL